MRCVFLDRDGVINYSKIIHGKPYAPTKFKEFKLIEGVKEGLEIIKEKNFKICVFTNQPDVKLISNMKQEVIRMHEFLLKTLPIDHIDVCFHNKEDNCLCRKPKIGMLIRSAKKIQVNLTQSLVVGDRWSDIQAGQNAGCKCYFIDYKYKEQQPKQPFTKIPNLKDFALLI
tara:strand:+ start:780 stop:1292 length:513 start_codon:yes stop_codon:yes gene_type:complete